MNPKTIQTTKNGVILPFLTRTLTHAAHSVYVNMDTALELHDRLHRRQSLTTPSQVDLNETPAAEGSALITHTLK